MSVVCIERSSFLNISILLAGGVVWLKLCAEGEALRRKRGGFIKSKSN